MSLAAPAGTEIVLMATVRSILGSRARNTAPIAPRPSSARISYRPNWCIVSIAQNHRISRNRGQMAPMIAREILLLAGCAPPVGALAVSAEMRGLCADGWAAAFGFAAR